MNLYLFDLDGTLIESYMDDPKRDFDRVALLPKRAEKIAELRKHNRIGIVTNQGGVAFGLVTPEAVERKLLAVADQLGFGGIILDDGARRRTIGNLVTGALLLCSVAYEHPNATSEQYKPKTFPRRKPSGEMIREQMIFHRIPEWRGREVTFVGDRPEDEQAAQDARVAFEWADSFFA